jgi:phosphohistidine phosphatase SixA
MTVYLVRHAVAVGRSEWAGDDDVRPLTKRGERQAGALVDVLTGGGADVRRILSSPAVRCRETVAPLGAKLGLDVEDARELAEGSKPSAAVDLVRAVGAKKGDTVLCAHGDLVPEIVRRLGRDGVRWDGDLRFAKGSTWVLDHDGERFTEARYAPPPD